MTVLSAYARKVPQQLIPRTTQALTRPIAAQPLLRVSQSIHSSLRASRTCGDSSCRVIFLRQAQPYATDAPPKPRGRPKAHTGATPAKRQPAAKRTASTKEAVAKKPKAKTAAKPKKVARKPKAKPKAKPKKRVLTEAGKQRVAKQAVAAQKTKLRQQALLDPPKKLPNSAWLVLFVENASKKGGHGITGDGAKAAAQAYRNMTPEEHERLNHIGNQNKVANDIAYKKWLASYTPLQVKEANHARQLLTKMAKSEGKKIRYNKIQDDRLVKLPSGPYSNFLQARVATGDFKGMTISETGKLIASEWHGLSTADKKPYLDDFAKARNRYVEEYKTVYGVDAPLTKIPASPRKTAS